jgi:hypothetical protein
MLALSMGTSAAAAEDNVMKELVPTGKLRVGVAYAPSPTPIFVAKDAAGNVRGVPRDLGNALAKTLGVPVESVRLMPVLDNSTISCLPAFAGHAQNGRLHVSLSSRCNKLLGADDGRMPGGAFDNSLRKFEPQTESRAGFCPLESLPVIYFGEKQPIELVAVPTAVDPTHCNHSARYCGVAKIIDAQANLQLRTTSRRSTEFITFIALHGF